jgi:hypothetical protein
MTQPPQDNGWESIWVCGCGYIHRKTPLVCPSCGKRTKDPKRKIGRWVRTSKWYDIFAVDYPKGPLL